MASLHEAVKRPQLDLDSGLTGSWPCPHPLIGKLSITVVPRPRPHEEKKCSGYNLTSHSTPEGHNQMQSEKSEKWLYNGRYSMSFCMLCRIPLPLSSKQRTMSTSVEANKEAVKSMLTFVTATLSDHDGNWFRTEYTCRPWFAKLEKGSRHRLFFFISKLRAAAQATESIEVAVNEPFPSLADSLCWSSSLRRTR